jgi:hypothetical protein
MAPTPAWRGNPRRATIAEGGAGLARKPGRGAGCRVGSKPSRGLFVLRPQKVVFVRVVCGLPVAAEERGDAGADLEGEVLKLLAHRRRQAKEAEVSIFGLEEDTVANDRVEVRIRIEAPAEALRQRDATAERIGDAEGARPLSLPGRDAPHDDAQGGAKDPLVAKRRDTHAAGEGHHPLAVRDRREALIAKIRSKPAHPPGMAGGACPTLATEGHEAVMPAVLANAAGHAVGGDPALQKRPKVALDAARIAEPRRRTLSALGEEGLEVILHHLIKDRVLGPATRVGRRVPGRQSPLHGATAPPAPLGKNPRR